ncbi:hypothetical protein N7478_000597 [Penicillium angulare]|uniref:uncharacterized protein n=1 Tax=Penicillium angulare TaxID=116970 RepID=UPI00253F7C1A|nr:uncharacterized protein N7478_000597 [Penicillium angulare]KAJ5291346.1 hypothetical protein N7478_000597 [Penicillium angulare]
MVRSETDNEHSYSKALEVDHSHELGAIIELIIGLEEALSGPDQCEKALFRKAQALYELQRFSESCEIYKLLSEKYPGSPFAQEEFARASARRAEQNTGNYVFKKMLSETESHGNGLFTTATVKVGDLLLCEKAFSYASHKDDDEPSAGAGTNEKLIELIVQKLYKNPSLLTPITRSLSGFLVECIVDLNAFKSPLTSRRSHINSRKGTRDEKFPSCGIWCLASHINHSCFNNACHSFIGDMMILRATKDLAPDTEITTWYLPPLLVKTWGMMNDDVVGCWMMLARAYRLVAPALQAQSVTYAKISYKICVGEDETFYKTYGRLSDRTDGLI